MIAVFCYFDWLMAAALNVPPLFQPMRREDSEGGLHIVRDEPEEFDGDEAEHEFDLGEPVGISTNDPHWPFVVNR